MIEPFAAQIPPDTTLWTYQDGWMTFQYPAAGRIFQFEHGKQSQAVRLVWTDESGEKLRIQIEPVRESLQAHAAARARYESRTTQLYANDINRPPFQFDEHGWRTRYLFADGLRAMLVFDLVFVETSAGVWSAAFSTAAPLYEANVWVFDQLVKTLQFGTS
ncbi:MAG TPA: hypothetical protein VHP83_08675 [Aggregatilineaceae bacterium]|nr:hypothetical protein [Aggregatilineaceae bacterium]